uniref:Speedy/RINGO cell cycle regulator family member A n=1 Tax=Salarias fasciatus TaxID=181472 RepID=A0A672HSI7_SALFA
HDPNRSVMTSPPAVTLRVKRKNDRHMKRHLCPNGASGQDRPGPRWPRQPGQHNANHTKPSSSSTWVIKHQEMDSFFRLFEDHLIQDFLMMDRCYKMTDKYLLAMTFVYFKRARFTTAEFTRRNFFIALYLANTMEEDNEKSKYEIFPWALGKTWRKRFPSFLRQRDKLWARIGYRAAISRRCCDEVMAIKSSHFVWQRQRPEHHSGAQREYGDQDYALSPRGPSASPASCAQCTRSSKLPLHPASSSSSKRKVQTSHNACLNPATSALLLEVTPPRPAKSQARCSKARAPEEAPSKEHLETFFK